ncbi:MAG: ferritin-like domain-containing protein [Gammaproteobacteria bacterium]|nr:MAG: ferritin-like domain-containing protein [Gammaproteobacteria bacterium]
MEQSTKLGSNKTGIDMSPIHSKQMLEGIERFPLTDTDTFFARQTLKQTLSEDAGSLGSIPLPATVKGVGKSILKTVTGHRPEMFINKLGERLAYERSGVRVYEALILKCQFMAANGMAENEIDISRLKQFRNQEAEHMELLVDILHTLGADATAQTPDADAIGVAASGLMKVVTDPRTTIAQCLEAMLTLELADNAAWDLLIKLADDMGHSDMVEKFQTALRQEDVHLLVVQQWHEKIVRSQASLIS